MGSLGNGLWSLGVLLAAVNLGSCKPKPVVVADAGARVVKKPRRPIAPGETRVDIERSKLLVATIKDRNTQSPVTATMRVSDGAIALADGTARLSIDLDSFDSAIPLRNERVRGLFFETSALGWGTAELTIAKIPDALLATLQTDRRVSAKLDADLKMHGKTLKLALPVDASYLGTTLYVRSASPLEIKISELDLTDNLKHLSAICMHDSIDDIVKVDVFLEFPKN